ncbi:MAG: protein-L-isoaspartate(D-aspartate) O-methyltransferase [Bacteroidetes bacterium]|jgi:protein-L-isoaspartate(D-aspartate) O-methyltransferase|nr:protein-L-isoaspartate(D-aspartate) O-methyltransferase [Bacteroidota bacterium]
MQDTFRHKGLRKQLVEEIRRKGITDVRVLEAMEKIPRHIFMDSSFLEFAYQDKPFPIGSGQTISQPYTVAFQTMLLEASRGLKVLEIGTGSGYQACVLAEMGAKVYSIERQRKLFAKTKLLLESLSWKVQLFLGDGNLGLPKFAPFDRILITAAAPSISTALVDQLKVGGLMVVPFGEGADQTMKRLIKLEDGSLKEEQFGIFRFVPLLGNIGND